MDHLNQSKNASTNSLDSDSKSSSINSRQGGAEHLVIVYIEKDVKIHVY